MTRLNKKITDIDYYLVEMQNPELTEPAGAGNVPEANYKMIAALAVMAGEIVRADIPAFGTRHGLPGFAPTQGHIPSGVPVLGFVRDQMLVGKASSAMLIDRPTARSKNSSCCSPWFVVSVLATSISGCVSPISLPTAA